MKKTTRNYVWILVANGLLLLAIGMLWEFRLRAVPATTQQNFTESSESQLTNKNAESQ